PVVLLVIEFYLLYDSNPIVFLFNHPAPTEIYTLSLHDALPILGEGDVEVPRAFEGRVERVPLPGRAQEGDRGPLVIAGDGGGHRSEEHTSELQSRENLVCRLLLEKKNKHKEQTKRCDRESKSIP